MTLPARLTHVNYPYTSRQDLCVSGRRVDVEGDSLLEVLGVEPVARGDRPQAGHGAVR